MKSTLSLTCLLILSALFVGCNRDSDGDPDALIDPANAEALSQVLILPDNTDRRDGPPPPTTSSSTTPIVDNLVANLTSSNGSTAPLVFTYANTDNDLAGCYVQVDGAGNFFTVPYTASAGTSGQLQLPIGIPTNVDEGQFDLNFCVYNDDGEVSNVVRTTVDVLRLGTGSLQVSLSWDNESDQDLYVTDPDGETIFYGDSFSSSGGTLDRDDTNGYGPENIYWTENAPDGTYSVSVNDFDFVPEGTQFYVTVSGPEDSRRFSGTTQSGNTVDVVTFTKNGDRLSF